jgi:hypothetical protein
MLNLVDVGSNEFVEGMRSRRVEGSMFIVVKIIEILDIQGTFAHILLKDRKRGF